MDSPKTPQSTPLQVGICETQPATAEGLRSLLEKSSELECAWVVPHLPVVVQLTHQARPDVVLLDRQFGQQLVLRVLEEILRHHPTAGVVIWGTAISEAEALRYLQAGARGLLKKTASLSAIERCLVAVGQGALWVEEALTALPQDTARATFPQLTPRESQVLDLVRRGMRNREIAAALGIRPGTVKIHLRHIFEKTGIHGRFSLALNLMATRPFAEKRRAEVA
ncbi:MAG: hypothetical protein KatS3mg005_2505 [Bryobacteraceae bacterium]|nr:MAG: hypothetical protein KatS3mg005_2505 [Bryobacteraceae bacterium]